MKLLGCKGFPQKTHAPKRAPGRGREPEFRTEAADRPRSSWPTRITSVLRHSPKMGPDWDPPKHFQEFVRSYISGPDQQKSYEDSSHTVNWLILSKAHILQKKKYPVLTYEVEIGLVNK